jgi:hypothetical protein
MFIAVDRLNFSAPRVLYPCARKLRHRKFGLVRDSRLLFLAAASVLFWQSFLAASSASATPAYVQSTFVVPNSSATTVPVTYTGAEKAGNLNVVIVGWTDTTTHIKSVTDNRSNSYQLAVGSTMLTSTGSLAMYYASNIAGGATTVTVTFDAAASNPDVRILEYSGIATSNPVDVTAAWHGNSSISSTNSVRTTNPMDLLVAGNMVQAATTSPGANFAQRELEYGGAYNIAEDRVVPVAGPIQCQCVSQRWEHVGDANGRFSRGQ